MEKKLTRRESRETAFLTRSTPPQTHSPTICWPP